MIQFVRSIGAALGRAWFYPDPRTLGLFRISLGLLCIVDIARRLPYVTLMYSDKGVLPNSAILDGPFSSHTFSLLLALGKPAEATAFFVAGIVFAVLFAVGYRTKLFHVLLGIVILSIHNKNILVENGGDQVMNIFVVWTLFLPLGRAYSVDSLVRRMHAGTERTSAELNDPAFAPPETRPDWSLAYFACLVQLAVIYFFNTVSKSGPTWVGDHSAIYYLLEQDRQVTALGYWARDFTPFWFTQGITLATLSMEGALSALILSPIFVKWTRRVAFCFVIALHVGIALASNVGVFSFIMITAGVLLLTRADMELLNRIEGRFAGPPVIVFYDSDCGICHFLARLVRRMDGLGKLTWAGRDWQGETPKGLGGQRDATIIVWDPASGRTWTHHRAVAHIVKALPWGALVSWVLLVPGLSLIARSTYDVVARNRTRISTFMGLTACGVQAHASNHSAATAVADSSAWTLTWRRTRIAVRDLTVAVIMVAAAITTINSNDLTKKRLGPIPRPAAFTAFVNYTRMYQRWNMFAKNVPKGEGWVVIDGELADGTKVDPQTGSAPVFGPVDFATGVDFGQMWRIYTKRIAKKEYKRFLPALQKWLKNRHTVHDLPADERLVAFDVWWITDKSPKPSERAQGMGATETARNKLTGYHPGKQPPKSETPPPEPVPTEATSGELP